MSKTSYPPLTAISVHKSTTRSHRKTKRIRKNKINVIVVITMKKTTGRVTRGMNRGIIVTRILIRIIIGKSDG